VAIFTAKGTSMRQSTSFESFCVNVVNVLVQPVISMRGEMETRDMLWVLAGFVGGRFVEGG